MAPKEKEKKGPKRTSKHETLKERVHRHLSDINSEITDDDIRSVQTELEIRAETKPDGAGQNAEEKKTGAKTKQGSPWNELSEGYD